MLSTKTITTGIAAAGFVMPAWLPSLQQASTAAATLVPIASLVWLVTQTVIAIRKYWRDTHARRD